MWPLLVRAGLSSGGFLTTSGTPDIRATVAVLLTPATGTAPTSDALLPLGPALDAAGLGAVVSGPAGSSAGTGAVAAVRKDAGTKAAVSTVDNADELMGRIAIVLALAQQIGGKQGHYGTGLGAAGPVPAGG